MISFHMKQLTISERLAAVLRERERESFRKERLNTTESIGGEIGSYLLISQRMGEINESQ